MRFSTRSNRCGIVATVLAIATTAGCIRSPQEKQAKLIERGQRYMDTRDYGRAVLDFRSAIRLVPNNAEPYYRLGQVYLKSGSPEQAAVAFSNALKRDPKHTGALVKMAELKAATGDARFTQQAETTLRGVLAGSPHQADALQALAFTELAQSKFGDAQQHFEQALQNAPKDLKSALALARLKMSQRDAAGAEAVLRKVVERAPESADAAVLLADFYLQTSRSGDAEQWFRRARQLDPRNSLALIGIAAAQIKSGHPELAEQSYRELSKLPARQYKHLLAAYLLYRGRTDEAIREFENLAAADPGYRVARNRLVGAYMSAGRPAEAARVLDAALRTSARDIDARMLRGQLLVATGKLSAAETDLTEVIRAKPDASAAHALLARIYQLRGDVIKQRQELYEALSRNPNLLDARIELARNLVDAGSAASALKLLDETPKGQKGALALLIQRNWVLLALGNDDAARRGIDQGLAFKRSGDLLAQDGVWKLRKKKYAVARLALAEALKSNPEDTRAMQALIDCYIAEKRGRDGMAALREQASRWPRSVRLQQLLGEKLMASGDRDGARQAFSAALAANPMYADAKLALARLYGAEGNPGEARRLTAEVLSLDSGNFAARLLRAEVDAQRGDVNAAIQDYQEILESDPASRVALRSLARMLSDSPQSLDQAQRYAQKAVEVAPESAEALGLLGQVLYLKGNYIDAVRYLESATTKPEASSPGAAMHKYHLAQAYQKMGQPERAHRLAIEALRMDPTLAKSGSSAFFNGALALRR